VWDVCPTLRAKGASDWSRASALQTHTASAVAGSATIPTLCDLKICVFLDYAATSLTTAISVVAYWREPKHELPPGQMRVAKKWGLEGSAAFVNGTNSPGAEEKQVLAFLKKLREILDETRDFDGARSTRNHTHALQADPQAVREDLYSTYQSFLWDEAQFRHLQRIIERHFAAIIADPKLRSLAWLFLPQDVLPHPDLASRQSSISLLAPAIEHHGVASGPNITRFCAWLKRI